jgi:hypothetical protein
MSRASGVPSVIPEAARWRAAVRDRTRSWVLAIPGLAWLARDDTAGCPFFPRPSKRRHRSSVAVIPEAARWRVAVRDRWLSRVLAIPGLASLARDDTDAVFQRWTQ